VDKLFRDLPPFDSTSSSGKVVGDVDVAIETHLQTLQVNELLLFLPSLFSFSS
jgi:hypothetical protein